MIQHIKIPQKIIDNFPFSSLKSRFITMYYDMYEEEALDLSVRLVMNLWKNSVYVFQCRLVMAD